ncbi:hypothetical protein EAS64_42660 [Trebonia kvetii]|uniref:Fibronectin type-III domain-containing protein n=1 Tax=Trebonia kvetii TaxID=2480626 RepID=A0A6P2BLJ4_9ACTN|nr:choice-of-anchor L domain-containing protein [Trebonia kvetii]TVY98961.1 hypothetical protein EAS64_42660 [Trebonia kvetii]
MIAGLSVTAISAQASEHSAGQPGTLIVTVGAPDGVPANVLIGGTANLIAAKPPAGVSTSVHFSLAAGAYHVALPVVFFSGARYEGKSSAPEAVIYPGKTTTLNVTYTSDGGARDVHVTAVTQTAISLSWTGPAGASYILRRGAGQSAPQSPGQGTGVSVTGTNAADSNLAAGTKYTYSLFTFHNKNWHGPLVITVSTTPAAGSTSATYVAEPSTFFAKAADLSSVTTTGTGVQVVLVAGVPVPFLGSAMILPVSGTLPGGFLGVVSAVSADGRTVALVAGGLSDAFDYYELSVDSFTTDPSLLPTPVPTAPDPGKPSATVTAPVSAKATSSKVTPQQPKTAVKSTAKGLAAPAATSLCGDVGVSQKVTFSPSIALGGDFATKLDKYNFLGVSVPDGASMSLALTAKVTGAVSIETSGDYSCSLPLPGLFKMLSVDPVPMALSLDPTAEFSIGGGVEISNLGASVLGGVAVSGSMSIKNGASFAGNTILQATPLTPDVKVNGTVGLKLGGEFILGPGVGTEEAAVIAGVKGEFDPIDASFKAIFPVGDPQFNLCTEAAVNLTAGLSLTAKAWLNGWSYEQDITLNALNGTLKYPGSPWDLPTGCNKPEGTPDSLLGPGVSKVSDSTTGSPDQWGHVDGFVPGQKTWVLSTGLVADAVGSPSQFASTNLGLPGDPDLSALAGYPTYDASSYTVTVIPTGSTLHVKYVFASEEYPEFVGSQYNDVMAVYVNGANCAFVPGTSTPVSINTINDHTNSQYYVDNSTGAAGYNTTMDGLTVPLTCSVPVTPGQPATVRIAVADTSDHIYDSAVALVDGGIWTD